MGELLWRRATGAEMCSETRGLRLTVAPAPRGDGYRYQLFGQSGDAPIALASGYRNKLDDAIAAAERTARGYSA